MHFEVFGHRTPNFLFAKLWSVHSVFSPLVNFISKFVLFAAGVWRLYAWKKCWFFVKWDWLGLAFFNSV